MGYRGRGSIADGEQSCNHLPFAMHRAARALHSTPEQTAFISNYPGCLRITHVTNLAGCMGAAWSA